MRQHGRSPGTRSGQSAAGAPPLRRAARHKSEAIKGRRSRKGLAKPHPHNAAAALQSPRVSKECVRAVPKSECLA